MGLSPLLAQVRQNFILYSSILPNFWLSRPQFQVIREWTARRRPEGYDSYCKSQLATLPKQNCGLSSSSSLQGLWILLFVVKRRFCVYVVLVRFRTFGESGLVGKGCVMAASDLSTYLAMGRALWMAGALSHGV